MRLTPYILPLAQFTLVGPGVGVLAFLLLGNGLASAGSDVRLLLLFGYGIGLVPAALAGVIYVLAWNARARFTSLTVREFGAVLGALSGLAAWAIFATAVSGTAHLKSPILHVLPLAAGLVCGIMAARARDEAFGWMDVS